MSRPSRSGKSASASHRSTAAAGSLRGKAATSRGAPSGRSRSGAGAKPSTGARGGTVDARRAPNKSRKKAEAAAASTIPPPYIPGPARPGRRLTPAYDLEGPRVRYGIAWFVVVFVALGVGRVLRDLPLVGVVYSVVAAVAAAQIVELWAPRRANLLRWSAMAIAGGVGLSASMGSAVLGGTILAGVALALIAGGAQVVLRQPVLPAVALVLQASLPAGLAAASVVLTMRYEIGALVILLAMVMAYDLGDYLIGSGAGSVLEGPVAGGMMIVLVAAVAAIIGAPPFNGVLVWAFALGAMVLCPLGQIVASWLLGDAEKRAPALRRLDSLLVLGPVWAYTAGLVAAKG